MRLKILICVFVIFWSQSKIDGQFFNPETFVLPSNYLRHCENDTPLRPIQIKLREWYSARVEQAGNETQIVPYAHLDWNVINPENASLDGFAVSFNEGLKLQMPPSLNPVNHCNAGRGHFWVKTNDSSVCEETNSTCQNRTTTSECLCKTNCSLIQFNPRECKHVGNYYMDKLGYFTVPADVRYLEFKLEWYKHYATHILPYYRQFVGDTNDNKVSFVSTVSDCIDSLVRGGDHSHTVATQTCCDHGFLSTTIRNFTLLHYSPDFNLQRLDVTATWLPPINRTEFIRFRPTVYPIFGHNTSIESGRWVNLTEEEKSQRANCDDTTQKYEVVISDVVPDSNIMLLVRSEYEADFSDKYCGTARVKDRCMSEPSERTPPFNVCDPMYKFCDPIANCTPFGDLGTLNATCTCPIGYEGNGINNETLALGTNCNDIDFCIPSLSPCSASANCDDLKGTTLGANCSCWPGYSGDGYKNGTVCRSDLVLALPISLSLVVVVFVIIGVIIYKIIMKRRRRNDFKWSQFVANTALQYTVPLNVGDSNECLPTFGDKWELDRDRIRTGDVLGRGNYGVVYKGWYNEGKSLVESSTEIPVAIKQVKDGQNEEDKLGDFLAEIGFMLNVGDHPNVLKVIGCCTTKKPIFLVTEFLKYGDLLHFLWDAREPTKCMEDALYHLTEKSLYEMSREVAQGMAYLTKARIIHGDLAARNILVGEGLVCKISDFGLANDVYRYGVIKGQSERCVPYKWISPERMMSGKVPITSKSDVWSFGNLMYEMVTLGCMPHPGVGSELLFEKLKAGYRMKQPSTCSDRMFSIMSKCWKWRSSARPSFTEIVGLLDTALTVDAPVNYVNLAHAVEEIDKEEYKKVVEPNNSLEDETKSIVNPAFVTTEQLDKTSFLEV